MTNSVISPQAGVDFTKTYTISTSTPEYPGLPFVPGTIMQGTNGSSYIFVNALSNVLYGRVVIINDMTIWQCRQITNALARAAFGQMVGVVAATDIIPSLTAGIAAGSYGWLQIAGYAADIQFNTGSSAFAQCYTDAASVLMSTTSAPGTNAAVNGMTLLTAPSGTTATAFLNYPTVGAAQ